MLTQNGNSRSTGEKRPMSGLNPNTKKRTTNGFYARSLFRHPIIRWRVPGNIKSPHPRTQPRTLTRRETSSETTSSYARKYLSRPLRTLEEQSIQLSPLFPIFANISINPMADGRYLRDDQRCDHRV